MICLVSRGKTMPTKHIDEETWRKIEKKTVEAIIQTNKSVKEGDMLKRLILIGLKHYDEEQKYKTVDEKKTFNRRSTDDKHAIN
jgi:hypothetical protein